MVLSVRECEIRARTPSRPSRRPPFVAVLKYLLSTSATAVGLPCGFRRGWTFHAAAWSRPASSTLVALGMNCSNSSSPRLRKGGLLLPPSSKTGCARREKGPPRETRRRIWLWVLRRR